MMIGSRTGMIYGQAQFERLPAETLLRDSMGALVLILPSPYYPHPGYRGPNHDLVWPMNGWRCPVRLLSGSKAYESRMPMMVMYRPDQPSHLPGQSIVEVAQWHARKYEAVDLVISYMAMAPSAHQVTAEERMLMHLAIQGFMNPDSIQASTEAFRRAGQWHHEVMQGLAAQREPDPDLVRELQRLTEEAQQSPVEPSDEETDPKEKTDD